MKIPCLSMIVLTLSAGCAAAWTPEQDRLVLIGPGRHSLLVYDLAGRLAREVTAPPQVFRAAREDLEPLYAAASGVIACPPRRSRSAAARSPPGPALWSKARLAVSRPAKATRQLQLAVSRPAKAT